MRTRPWPLTVIAIFQAIAPAFNIVFCAKLIGVSSLVYMSALWQSSTSLQLFEFYALGPIAAFAIYHTRKWSYPVFLAITAYTAFRNYQSYQHFPSYLPLSLLMAVYAINALFVGYFLMPAVRMAYFNPKVRWWESQPRYKVTIDGQAGESTVKILNLSEGGAFVEASAYVSQGAFVLTFEWQGASYGIDARVVHRRSDGLGLGLQFAPSRAFRQQMKVLTRQFEEAGIAKTLERGPWYLEFRSWAMRLMQTGHGWVPEFSSAPVKPKLVASVETHSKKDAA